MCCRLTGHSLINVLWSQQVITHNTTNLISIPQSHTSQWMNMKFKAKHHDKQESCVYSACPWRIWGCQWSVLVLLLEVTRGQYCIATWTLFCTVDNSDMKQTSLYIQTGFTNKIFSHAVFCRQLSLKCFVLGTLKVTF